MYPIHDAIERQRVEWIHGLTGGETADRPFRMLDLGRGKRLWARYWYEGAPDWSNEHAYDSGRKGWRGSWRTLVWDSGSYGSHLPPQSFRDSSGRRWRKVASYRSAAECECPVPDSHLGKVTRREAVLLPANKWDRQYPKRRKAECPMCEERIGSEHSYLYLGEGWLEAVYFSPDEKE